MVSIALPGVIFGSSLALELQHQSGRTSFWGLEERVTMCTALFCLVFSLFSVFLVHRTPVLVPVYMQLIT